MFLKIKILLTKLFYNFILIGDKNLSIIERIEFFLKSLLTIAPIAFLVELTQSWVLNNQKFTTAVVLIILINMVIGAYIHVKKGDFKWKKFITKSISMVIVINITYIVLELILGRAGENFIVEGFRAALQVATLLYPGSKILKNIFILSNGEHPPKWVMQKIYNFQENGDLKQFLTTTKPIDPNLEEEDIEEI